MGKRLKSADGLAAIEQALLSDTDGCITGPFKRTQDGYARIHFAGKMRRVTRLICGALAARELLPDEVAMHSCDNPPCINPKHLRIGSHADNQRDSVEKGRKAHGAGHGRATLRDDEVLTMRALYAQGGWTQEGLAKRFGVSKSAVKHILRRRHWRHLLLPENPDALLANLEVAYG